MARYEIVTRISNGRKPALPIGDVREFDDDEARGLMALGALRPIAGESVEAGGEPVGTAQRATAAGTADGELSFITMAQTLRTDLDKLTVRKLDALAEAEGISLEGAPNKPDKIEAIVAARSTKMLGQLDRAQLLDLAAASGYADVAALELSQEAAEDEIRAALMRVAAAKAD